MNKDQEKSMLACWERWKKYLNPIDKYEHFDPPTDYVRGFRDGIKYQSGVVSPDEYLCPYCGRKSYPDYGVCVFCGVR